MTRNVALSFPSVPYVVSRHLGAAEISSSMVSITRREVGARIRFNFLHTSSIASRYLSLSFSFSFSSISGANSRSSSAAEYPLTFPLTLLFFPFFVFLKLSSEIRAVSNFDHANIRWLRRVTPLGSRRRSINAHERVRYREHREHVALVNKLINSY